MARAVSVSVSVEALSTETGIWCDTCLLSSAVRLNYATTVNGSTTLASKTVCGECS